ncbi:MAG: radical SAM protein [Candidatus Woesearchaeota archaeon]
MKVSSIQKTPYYSWKIGALAKGCQECVKGNKLVLFITGLCSKRCFFCPISDQKWLKDDVYANEWKVKSDKDIIEEAKLTDAKGAGFTGGDPLVRFERTIRYIRLLKKKFGKDFHIHLYTPLELLNFEKLKKLYEAGLDEIRFHPDLENRIHWNKIKLAKNFKWKTGIEIPAIPGFEKKIKELIDFSKDQIDFLNINELEMSDTNMNKLVDRGFRTKNNLSYGVRGSDYLAKKLLKYSIGKINNVHYCTCTLKDKIQMANRIKKRAKNIALSFDKISNYGTLIRGVIYQKDLIPGFNYRKKIWNLKNNKKKEMRIIRKLNNIKTKLYKKYAITKNNIIIDTIKYRLIINQKILNKIKENIKKEGLIPAIIEEYPTHDSFEIEINFI